MPSANPLDPAYTNPAAQVDGASLINPSAPAAMATPGTAAATGFQGAQTSVNAPSDTVQGQIGGIIAANSPLMQQAHRRAMERMNSRGLLNSSLAVQAGESALYDAALPIAQADAGVYNQTRLANQASDNAGRQFTAAAENAASATNAQLATETNARNAAAANTLQLTGMDQAFKTAIANSDAQNRVLMQQLGDVTKTTLANIEADFKTLMQTSASATDMYRQSMDGISKVVADTNMNAQAKATAINGYLGWLRNGMNLVASINGVDLGNLLNFGTVTAN